MIDIELAYRRIYQSSRTRSGHSRGSHNIVDLSMESSGIPYTIDFSRMKQKRHGYGTERDIKREALPPGQSLQSLLQTPPPPNHMSLHSVSAVPGSSGFSLSIGPAMSILKSGIGSSGGATSSAVPAVTPAGSSGAKPTTKKSRGKRTSSASSSSPSLSRRGKSETEGESYHNRLCVYVWSYYRYC